MILERTGTDMHVFDFVLRIRFLEVGKDVLPYQVVYSVQVGRS